MGIFPIEILKTNTVEFLINFMKFLQNKQKFKALMKFLQNLGVT